MESIAYNEFIKNSSFEEIEASLFLNRRKKIMVIDDDQDFRISLCEFLVDEGFSVTTAKDGEVALNNLIHQKDLPNLILVDVMMPVKSGLEFRREQLQLEEICSIPVMFMTGMGEIPDESVLLKPFDQKELLDRIRGAF